MKTGGITLRNRLLALFLALLMILPVSSLAGAQDFDFRSAASLLMDAGSGQVLYESNAHERLYPASVTKIMTMILAMEALESGKVKLDDMVQVSHRAASMGGSQIFLSPGDAITFEEMMIGIGVGSANDGAVALAEHLAGSVEAFVDMMNEKAAQLGMENTHFANPHGLHDENHYTTAYDIALMSRELLKHPKIHDWLTIWMDEEFLKGKIKKSDGVFLSNSNNLVRFYSGCDGLKTGFTNEAGNCVSATARRGDTRFIAVVMKAPGRPVLFEEARELLDWGFANFTGVPVVRKGEVLGRATVDKGLWETVDLVAAEDLSLLLKKGTDQETRQVLNIPERLPAPLAAGQVAGTLEVMSRDGEVLGRVDLVAAEDVPRANLLTFFRRAVNFWLCFGRQ